MQKKDGHLNEGLRQQVLNALDEAGLPASSLDKLIELHEALTDGGSGSLNWFDLVDTVVKDSSLFALRRDALDRNATRSAALLGISKGAPWSARS